MTRSRKWLLAVLVVGLVVVFLGWRAIGARKAREAAAPAAAAKAEVVVELAQTDVVRAQELELTTGVPVSGSLRAVNSAAVKARVAGELQGLTVREGDVVKAGQVLARIDPTESQGRLRQAQQQADAAKAQIEIAQRQYDNNKALVDQGFISRTALDTSLDNLNAAKATYQASTAAADVARKTLDDTVLRAPIDGVVSQRVAQPGERVGIDAKVLDIVDLRRLELEATLGAADSVQLQAGQAAQLKVEGLERPVPARVARINPSAQAGSRSVLAYLSIDDPAGLRQGLFAQGRVLTGATKATAVPLAAIRADKPSPYVQVVEGGRVVHKAVQQGARGEAANETWVAVDGVPAGTTVLKGHLGQLREGTAVRFTGGTTAAPAASGAKAA
ncbi:efflux RND transporter periplasmic adaptor subunit [Ramlibacter algicola]|uniref:Efflux RND transporter periplasmic adaptor subunit n=1 Tax=Ramlibacter algicola TaxID=2795217 RepID=A0A934PZJ7_9BURK|nr:efflux RND transporter periplasmic adaptor subunit [Ramlibacter algicola]MBK0392278.1 efflux RND transporter periplasmic adaptor subunit [Ramlibacter algicola]